MMEQRQYIPQQCALVSNVVSSNTAGLQVTQKQTLVDVRSHCSLGDFTNILLRAVGHVVCVSKRILAKATVTS